MLKFEWFYLTDNINDLIKVGIRYLLPIET